MPQEVVAVQSSNPLAVAKSRNSDSLVYQSLGLTFDEPTGDGVFSAGQGGSFSASGLMVLPYALGEAGGEFTVRVYGWRSYGRDPNTLVWLPTLLTELFCVIGDLPGGPGRLIRESERFCDIMSGTGAVSSGVGLVAYALVNLMGSQKFQFDFAMGEELPAFPNALWAPI